MTTLTRVQPTSSVTNSIALEKVASIVKNAATMSTVTSAPSTAVAGSSVKTLLLLGGLGVVGYLIYRELRK